jgi:hypothetical protein
MFSLLHLQTKKPAIKSFKNFSSLVSFDLKRVSII